MSVYEQAVSSEDEDFTDSDDDNVSVIILSRNERLSSASRTSSSFSDSENWADQMDDANGNGDEPDAEDHLRKGDIWSNLPSLAVENIYSYLGRSDQYRMSLVCKKWSKDYGSPSIWKTIKFYLPEYDYFSEIYPEIRFAKKYGSMFRHVEIICKRVRAQLLGVIWKQLKLFLQTLTTESQLQSIKFISMGNYFRHLDDFIHHDIFRVIVNFFSSQRNLTTIEFLDSRFTKEEGVEILKALTEASESSLRSLSLKGFVVDSVNFEDSSKYTDNLSSIFNRLLCIQTLDIEYTKVFEDILWICQENSMEGGSPSSSPEGKRSLSSLNLYCEGSRQTNYHGILPSSWKNLSKSCPDLKVNLDLNLTIHARNEIERFIVRFMPLQTLELRLDKPSVSPRTDISFLFDHLVDCKCSDHLEVVNVIWIPPITHLAETLTPFLQACQKLRTIQIHARYCISGIEDVCKALLENRPRCLKSITLWFNDVRNEEDEGNLSALTDEYYPLLQFIGIEIFLLVDPGRRLRRRNS